MRILQRLNIINISKCIKYKHTLSAEIKIDPIQEASLSEKCILTDEADKEIGPVSKKECHLVNIDGSILLHRAFSVFIFNSKNELLIQQRSSTKVTYPNYLTNACCSHPLYDIENERDGVLGVKLAAQRRLKIELGIPFDQCPPDSLQYLTRLHYFNKGDGIWGEHEIDYVLILHKDVTMDLNFEEVNNAVYVTQEQLKEFSKSSKYPFTPWFQLISSNWLVKWWNNLNNLDMFKDDNIHKFN